MKKHYTTLLTIVLIMASVLSACGGAKDTKLNDVQKAGKLVIGTSADYPPYEFHKSVNGKDEIVGFDIEIAKTIAKDLGVQLEVKDMDFKGLLAALDTGSVDIVLSGMTPDEDRKKTTDFSNIYYTAEQIIVTRADETDKYKTMDDLKGKKVGVQKGSIQEKIAQKQLPNTEAKALGKISDLMLELKNKKVDALIVEKPIANAYISKNKDLAIAQAKPQSEDAGSAVAVKKDNPKLVEKINATLDKLSKDKKIDEFVANANDLVE